MASEDQGRLFMGVVARAMSDEAFRTALLADSNAVLSAEGVDVPAGVEVTVVQASPTQTFLVLPDPSTVSEELLAASVGGSTVGSGGTVGCAGTFVSCVGTVGSVGTAGSK